MTYALTLLYILLVIFRPHQFLGVLNGFPIISCTLILAAISWAFSSKEKFSQTPQYLILFLFICLAAIGTVLHGGFVSALHVFITLLPLFFLFMILSSSTQDYNHLKKILSLIFFLSVILGIHGILQLQNGVGWTGAIPVQGRITYIGIFNDPNDLGQLLTISIPIGLYLLKGKVNILYKLFCACCLLLIFYSIYLTNSRGSFIAAGLVITAYTWKNFGFKYVILLCFIGLPLFFSIPTRLDEIAMIDSSAVGRLEAWYVGEHLFFDNPLLGVGFERFTEHHFRTAHNSFILALAELGFIGYSLWMLLIGTSIRLLYKITKIHGNITKIKSPLHPKNIASLSNDSETASCILLMFIGFLTTAFFLSRTYSLVLIILLGLAIGHYQGAYKRNETLMKTIADPHWSAWLLYIVISLIMLLISIKVFYIIK